MVYISLRQVCIVTTLSQFTPTSVDLVVSFLGVGGFLGPLQHNSGDRRNQKSNLSIRFSCFRIRGTCSESIFSMKLLGWVLVKRHERLWVLVPYRIHNSPNVSY